MGRLLLGTIKGLILGSGLAYALYSVSFLASGALTYLVFALFGATVGLICGRAPWRAETIWTPVLKALFGVVVGTGLYALGHRYVPAWTLGGVLPGLPAGLAALSLNSGVVLAPAIGLLYGAFVEVDDGASGEPRLTDGKAGKALPAKDAT